MAESKVMVTANEQAVWDGHRLRALVTWYKEMGGKFIFGPPILFITLAASGFPPWRVAVAAALTAIVIISHSVAFRRMGRDPDAIRQTVLSKSMMVVPISAIQLALTGGLLSPMLVLYLSTPASTMLLLGPKGGGNKVMFAAAALLLPLAFLPAAWAGPPIARGFAIAVTLESIALVVVKIGGGMCSMWRAKMNAQQEIERLREDNLVQVCERSRRLQQMSAKVAHELKNPLAAIKGLMQLLERSERDSRDRERMSVVSSEVQRMEEILRDYLSYSKPFEELNLEGIELGGLAKDVVATLAGRADGAGVALHVQNGTRAVARADRRRLKEAFINLVQNAIEACDRGGSVELAIRRDADRAEVVIADDGHGIPPDALARLGTPFFTTREDGTGLGVVLARSVVVHHGGTLEFESSGHGTRVTIQLPLDVTV